MSIVYPLSIPATNKYSRVNIGADSAVAESASPLTFASQTQEFPGKRWRMDVALRRMTRAQAEDWITFLLKLKGRSGYFLAGDPLGQVARGVATFPGAAPYVNAQNPTGSTLPTAGWTPSQSGILLRGDWIQIGTGLSSRLYKVLNDVDSDGSGEAILDVYPDYPGSGTPTELLTDGSCDSLTGWTQDTSAGTIALDAATKIEGTNSIQLDRNSGTGEISIFQEFNLTPGKSYRLRGRCRSNAGAFPSMIEVFVINLDQSPLQRVDENGVWSTGTTPIFEQDLTATWEQIDVPFFVKPNFATSDDYRITIRDAKYNAATEPLWVDDFRLEGPDHFGQPIEVSSPVGLFQLRENSVDWSLLRAKRYEVGGFVAKSKVP